MTLEEAAARIGDKVVYHQPHQEPEEGVITSVNARYVFVRYGSQVTSAATCPEDLEPLAGER